MDKLHSSLGLGKISLFRTAQDWDHAPSVSHPWTVHLEPSIRPCHTLAVLVYFCCSDKTSRRKQLSGERAYLALVQVATVHHVGKWRQRLREHKPASWSHHAPQSREQSKVNVPLLACAQLRFSILRPFQDPLPRKCCSPQSAVSFCIG